MKKEPDIVKELREQEKTGKLTSSSAYSSLSNIHLQQSANPLTEEENKEDYLDVIRRIPEAYNIENEDEQLYKSLVENTLEGIVILNFKGNILFANPAIVKLFEFSSIKEIIGKNALNYIDQKYHEQIMNDQRLLQLRQESFLNTYKAVTAKGKQIWVECLGTKIKYNGKTANVVFVRDVTHRQATLDNYIKLEKKYRAIAEMSADGILTLDPLGKLTYVNPSFRAMIGRQQEQLTGEMFRDFIADEFIYLFQQIFLEARKKEEPIEHVEVELIHKNNHVIPVELSLSPLKEDNEFSGMVCTVHDITERKKMEEEIRKSEQLKTEFMNIAAHELKSPVTPIKGYLDLIISDENTDPKIKKWAQISLRNAERLLLLVNDILDVSRLDSDTMSFNMKKISINEVLNEVVEDMKPLIENKHLTFNVNISPDLPPILGDHHRLTQVLRNLLTNAIKFTDNGSITIAAKKTENHIVISVEDTGIGIPHSDLKKIFKKFYQVDTKDCRKNEGTGLGLYICKEIIKRHKGTIHAESTLGKGSKFIITLPYLQN